MRDEIFEGCWRNDIIGFHTHAYCRNFRDAAEEPPEAPRWTTSVARSSTRAPDPGPRPSARDRRRRLERAAASPEVVEDESRRCAAARPPDHPRHRVDLSKNVLRGFTVFDGFVPQHPEFRDG